MSYNSRIIHTWYSQNGDCRKKAGQRFRIEAIRYLFYGVDFVMDNILITTRHNSRNTPVALHFWSVNITKVTMLNKRLREESKQMYDFISVVDSCYE